MKFTGSSIGTSIFILQIACFRSSKDRPTLRLSVEKSTTFVYTVYTRNDNDTAPGPPRDQGTDRVGTQTSDESQDTPISTRPSDSTTNRNSGRLGPTTEGGRSRPHEDTEVPEGSLTRPGWSPGSGVTRRTKGDGGPSSERFTEDTYTSEDKTVLKDQPKRLKSLNTVYVLS